MKPPPSRIADRLRKLLALARDSDSPECRAARGLYERLLADHGVDRAAIEGERRELRAFRYQAMHRRTAARIFQSLGVEVWWGRRKNTLTVLVTQAELRVGRALYNHAVAIYNRKARELRATLKSFLWGFLEAAFPLGYACPACQAGQLCFHGELGRYVCDACGHWGDKPRTVALTDPAAFAEGASRAARPLLET